MDCKSASEADRVCEWGEGVQCPNDRKPIFFTGMYGMMWHVRGYVSMQIGITTPSCPPPFDITPKPPGADFIPPFEKQVARHGR